MKSPAKAMDRAIAVFLRPGVGHVDARSLARRQTSARTETMLHSEEAAPSRTEAADTQAPQLVLPERLARIINHEVVAARSKVIEERYRQRGAGSTYRRRYIEVMANHVLRLLNNA